MIVTTESGADEGAETLCMRPLVWVGAAGGSAWRQSPLKLAFGRLCMFRPLVIDVLERDGVDWELSVESDSDRTIEATVSADLAVQVVLKDTQPPHLEVIDHGGTLPDLPEQRINLFAGGSGNVAREAMADLLRAAFCGGEMPRLRAVGA